MATSDKARDRGIPRRAVLALPLALALRPRIGGASGPRLGGRVLLPPIAPAPSLPGAALRAAGAWKAVYVVGSVDGVDGSATRAAVEEASQGAAVLRELGGTVVELYPPADRWEEVKAAATEAQALIYSGHGVYHWDGDPNKLGGFCFSGGCVHPDRVREELRLAPGGIVVMNHACFTAGASGTDSSPVSLEEAQRRVAMYSLPFLQAGLSGYFANNYYHYVSWLFRLLVEGKTHEGAYQSHYAYRDGGGTQGDHPQLPGRCLWVDAGGSHAFAGEAARVFGSAAALQLGLSASGLRALAQVGDRAPRTLRAQVTSSGGDALPWTAAVGSPAGWLHLDTTAGQAGDLLSVTVYPPAEAGDYSAEVIVSTGDPRVENPEVRLPVSLGVGLLTNLPLVSG